MAYVADIEHTFSTAGAASFAVTLPEHVADDVLLVCITQDSVGTHTITGWTQIGSTQSQSTNITSSVWYKKATSSSETCTVVCSVADAMSVHALLLKDVDTTTALSGTPGATNAAAASQFNMASMTTATADALVIYYIGMDGIATQGHSDPGACHFIASGDSTGTTATTSASGAVGWYIQRATGATPTPGWTLSASVGTTRFVMAFRNKSGGRIPAYIDDVSSPGAVITPGHHFSTLNGISFPASLSLANIGPSGSGKTTVFDAAAAAADVGINPYSNALSSTPATQAATGAAGFQIDLTSTMDFTTGWLVGTIINSAPKGANFFHGNLRQGGTYAAFRDASNRYKSFQIAARDSKPNTEERMVFSVQCQDTTRYGYSATALSVNAVKSLLFLTNCPSGAVTLYFAEIYRALTQVVAGGDANFPVDSGGLAQAGSSFRVRLLQRFGAAGILALVPVQIGGGDAVNFQIDAGALLFPRNYNPDTNEVNYHGTAGAIGISYAGKSGDVIKHTNSVVTSPSSYYWEIHANATNAATWDFTGLTIVGAVVTLRNVMTFSEMTFSSCGSITASGCTLDGCTISKVPATNDSLVLNASSNIDNCLVNTTTITAGNRLCSVADPSVFDGCTFIGSGSSGHAIRITTPGTYTFSGNVFSGYGANGTTSAAIYNDSGGAVTLNISGGGSTPTYRNGAGASTTINNNVNVTLTGLVNPTEVRVYTRDGSGNSDTEIAGSEDITTGSFQFSGQAGVAVNIVIFSVGYQPADILNYTIPASAATLPIQQVFDRVYANP